MTANQTSIWASRSTDPNQLILHATAVSARGRALVLGGPSGVGKARLALELMAYGAELIADDMVHIRKGAEGVIAAAVSDAPSGIELRHIGIAPARLAAPAPVLACVDLRPIDVARLPDPEFVTLLGVPVRLIQTSREGPFAPALWHYLTQSETGNST